jgi:bifunctional non-homologous end joining protein LigD
MEFQPMLVGETTQLPSGRMWSFEPKLDGWRLIVIVAGGVVTLLTRGGQNITRRYAKLAEAITAAVRGHDCVLDGELVVLDPTGRPSQFGGANLFCL